MKKVSKQPVKDPPNLIGVRPFSFERLMSHTDPGPAEECEEFIRLIYEARQNDKFTSQNGKNGR
ncbi:MAG: hypothetical protein ACKV2U_11220 [Bryobacteraceae bacterium]